MPLRRTACCVIAGGTFSRAVAQPDQVQPECRVNDSRGTLMTPKNTTKSIVRVLITEGTRMASRLLADALSQQSSLEVVAATCGANESLLAVTEKRPDVILLSDG